MYQLQNYMCDHVSSDIKKKLKEGVKKYVEHKAIFVIATPFCQNQSFLVSETKYFWLDRCIIDFNWTMFLNKHP